MTKQELIDDAKSKGTPGAAYWWTDTNRRAVQSRDYTMPDGRIIGVPEKPGYPVEVRHPDGRIEYV